MIRHNGLPNPVISSPSFRRRRTLWFFVLAFVATILLISSRSETISSASVWGDYFGYWPPLFGGGGGAGRKKKNGNAKEIHGLQHFVVNSDASLSNLILEAPEGEDWKLDPKEEIDLRVYSSFNDDQHWERHVKVLMEKYPVVVFSKSYCPYSKKAKQLLESYDLSPPPKIIEVDLRDDTEIIKVILTRLTNHSTFPNIILKSESLGGSDNIHTLHDQGRLKDVFEKNGVRVRGSLTVSEY